MLRRRMRLPPLRFEVSIGGIRRFGNGRMACGIQPDQAVTGITVVVNASPELARISFPDSGSRDLQGTGCINRNHLTSETCFADGGRYTIRSNNQTK